MADQLTVDIQANDNASKVLNDVDGQMQKVDKTATEANENATETGKKTTRQTESMGGAFSNLETKLMSGAAALDIITQGFGAVQAVVSSVRDAITDLTEAYREQWEVNQQLSVSNESLAATATAAENVFAQQGEVIADLAVETQYGDEVLAQSVSTYQDLTGELLDAEAAQDRLNIASGIAAKRQIDLGKATEALADAQKGRLRSLSRLLPAQRETLEDMQNIEDAEKRAQQATELLRDSYGGAAQELNQGFFAALKNLTDAIGDTQQAIGELVVESKIFDGSIQEITGAVRDFEGWIEDNRGQIERWGEAIGIVAEVHVAGLIDGVQNIYQQYSDLQEVLGVAQDETEGLANAVTRLIDAFNALWSASEVGMAAIPGLGMALSQVSGSIRHDLLPDTEQLREEAKEIAEERKMERRMEGWYESLDLAKDGFNQTKQAAEEFGQGVSEWFTDAQEELSEGPSDRLQKLRMEQQILQAQNPIQERRLELQKEIFSIKQDDLDADEQQVAIENARIQAQQDIADEQQNIREERQKAAAEQREQLAEAAGKAKEWLGDTWDRVRAETEEREELERTNQVAGLKLAALREEDEVRAARLEKEAELAELEGEDLTRQQRKLRETQIEQQHQERLVELERERKQEAQEGLDKIRARQREQAEQAFAVPGGIGEGLEGVEVERTRASEQATEQQRKRIEQRQREQQQIQETIQAYGQLGSKIGDLGEPVGKLAEQNWDFAEATDATAAGLSGISSAGGAAASLLADSTKETAQIRGAFEAAAATAATAAGLAGQPQMFAAAAQHAAASVGYFAVAGSSGGGGGGGASGGGGGGGRSGRGGSRSGGASQVDPDEQRERFLDGLDRRLNRDERPDAIEINNNFGSQSTTFDRATDVASSVAEGVRDVEEIRMTRSGG